MDKIQRIDYIEKKRKAAEENRNSAKFQIPWQGGVLDLPIINVEKDFLRYRLENGRTQRKQLEYVERPGIDNNLFSDPESEKAQSAQHQILKEMAVDEGLKGDIIKYGQRQSAIITQDGFVLNGNRRLAALREYTDTEFVQCVVLPKEASAKDLYDLEMDLQMAKEMKADYNWVDELLTIRRGIEKFGEKEKLIAKRMRIGPNQIRYKLNMLIIVDLYLEWLGKHKKYYIFGDRDEQVFIELEKFTRKTKNAEKQKLARIVVFGALQDPPEAGRLYKHVTRFFRHIDEAIKKFQEEHVKDKREEKQEKIEISDDPLEKLAATKDIIDEDKVIAEVTPFFENPKNAKENIRNILEYSEDAEELEKEKKDRNASFNKVGEAQRKLESITINSQTGNKIGIKNKLIEIKILANKYIEKINEESKGDK